MTTRSTRSRKTGGGAKKPPSNQGNQGTPSNQGVASQQGNQQSSNPKPESKSIKETLEIQVTGWLTGVLADLTMPSPGRVRRMMVHKAIKTVNEAEGDAIAVGMAHMSGLAAIGAGHDLSNIIENDDELQRVREDTVEFIKGFVEGFTAEMRRKK